MLVAGLWDTWFSWVCLSVVLSPFVPQGTMFYSWKMAKQLIGREGGDQGEQKELGKAVDHWHKKGNCSDGS